ncbi:MAG: hypothetical protein ACJATA_001121 [Sphingobacteriales bacterium]|jgi:hypothetical protein
MTNCFLKSSLDFCSLFYQEKGEETYLKTGCIIGGLNDFST